MNRFIEVVKQDVMRTISTILLLLIFGGQVISVPSMMRQIGTISNWVVSEMVRQVEKQYTKINEKPDDLYQTDVEYVINVTWPSIPDSRKSESLKMQYEFIYNYYKTHVLNDSSFSSRLKNRIKSMFYSADNYILMNSSVVKNKLLS
jgi:hypothetical protein